MEARTKMGRWTKALLAVLGIAGGISITTSWSCQATIHVQPDPDPALMGWDEESLRTPEAREIIASTPPLLVVGDVKDHSRDNVRLWEATLQVHGEHHPNYAQQIGDCVSFGTKNVLQALQDVQIVLGQRARYHDVYPPYIYGVSRVQIGKGRLRGDGSNGSWAAKGCQEYGVLRSDAPGVPAYSGSVAKKWGSSGPPKEFLEIGREYLVQSVAPMRSAADVRDAICNGYPVTIASQFGTKTIRERDGRMVAAYDGSWAHQMAVLAYDGATGSEPYFYVLNSWGVNAHPKPLQGEPPGGFWVTVATMDKITRSGDCWAYSGFAGFPAQDLSPDDFSFVAAQSGDGHFAELAFQGWPIMGRIGGLLLLGAAGLLWISDRRHRGLRALVCGVALLTTIQQVHAEELLTAADFSFAAPAHVSAQTIPADEGLTAADFSFAGTVSEVKAEPLGKSDITLSAADFSFVCNETLCYRAPAAPACPAHECNCAETNVCTCGGKCDCCQGDKRPVVRLYLLPEDLGVCPPCKVMKEDARQVKGVRFVVHDPPEWVESYPTLHFRTPDGWRQLKGWQGAEWFQREYRRAMEPRQVIGSQPIGPLGWAWPRACYSRAG